ncbi:hypothetical protein TTX_1892 [Thermoproteus tenax Kra 1]|uniref:Uncharacterized protein n=1 Tax=Thermoproteus tenax (strain ATCC 35583 / DSM 2078 / JCM 9277 / NBRC 100435 / Kra 1) TaxID=768679 RepID=G4RLR4_THETK|nr:hypothetical protein TTX_1892 [Thermoproteus tenax Kra 1]
MKIFETLISLSRERGLRIEISFLKCKGRLLIDKELELKAVDEFGNISSWARVFPGISIQNILDQCGVKKIDVYKGQEKIVENENIYEVIRELGGIASYK